MIIDSYMIAPPAAGFDPQTQGTLVSWYDASTLGLSNGANISSFTDSKTGNPYPLGLGYYSYPGTPAGYPVYTTGQQNGLATAYFNGSSFLYCNYHWNGTDPRTTVAAIIKVADHSARYPVAGAGGGNQMGIESSTGYPITMTNNNNWYPGSSEVTTGSYHLVVWVYDYSPGAYGNITYYIDGVAAGGGGYSWWYDNTGDSGLFYLGFDSWIGSLTGYIGELQRYSSVLSSGDLSALHTYMVNKWATP